MAKSHAERIKASVTISTSGCWLWNKTKAHNGYGSFALGGGKNVRAHRASYEALVGPIPAGHNVCHRCDVRACVNPEHLFAATQSDNIRDAVAKGRACRSVRVRGEAHGGAKLTDNCVSTILSRLAEGEPKLRLSRAFGVSQRTILLIARGESWKHIPRPETAQ